MYAFIGLIVLIILLICVYYIIKAFRNKYTKSRFAFLALSSISSISLLIVMSLLSGQTPIQAIIEIFYQFMGWDYTSSGPSLIELTALCFITWMLYSFCNTTFKNWNGPITESQHKNSIRREEDGLLVDGYIELKRLLKGKAEQELHENKIENASDIRLKTPDDSLAWHIQACELISLVRPDLFFEPHGGWVEEESCWHGESKTTANKVQLYCSIEDVTDSEVASLLAKSDKYLTQPEVSACEKSYFVTVKGAAEDRFIKMEGFDVEIYSEESLLNKLVNFTDYYYELGRRVEKETLPESNFTILDTYEISEYTIEGKEKIHNNIESYLLEWLSDSSRRQVAILGEYGQGKSTLSLMFAYRIIRKKYQNINYIPIIIELRGKSPATMTPEDVLSSWSTKYQIKSSALKKLLISGRILLILEGFDEMAFLGDAETRINHFKTLWSLNYPKAKILITGRPNFFLDDSEMKNALGILNPVLGKPYCEAVHLSPFDIERISSSLKKFPKKTRTEIIQFANKDDNFRDLASRPSTLYLIAVLWDKENLSQYGENINSALIMGLFISYSYSRQYSKEEGTTQFMFLNENERSYFMSGVAAYMARNYLPNQISGISLREQVLKLLDVVPKSVSSHCSAIQGGGRTALRERINSEDDKLEQLQTDVRSCGILVRDVSSPGTLKFSHKSFMEYLSAEVAAKYIDDDDDSSSILAGIKTNMFSILVSPEIVSFFAELLENIYRKKQDHKNGMAGFMLDVIAAKEKGFIKRKFKLEALKNSSKSKLIRPFYYFLSNWFMLFTIYGETSILKTHIWEICCAKLGIPTSEMEIALSKGCGKILEKRRDELENTDKHMILLRLSHATPLARIRYLMDQETQRQILAITKLVDK